MWSRGRVVMWTGGDCETGEDERTLTHEDHHEPHQVHSQAPLPSVGVQQVEHYRSHHEEDEAAHLQRDQTDGETKDEMKMGGKRQQNKRTRNKTKKDKRRNR